ncbi:MAG: hypothetical protein NZL98_02065, partial [Anaerolineales bacterium]|nr:hypothetical protein [Anaerolineales bacterium]
MRQKVSFWLLGLAVVLLALACNLSTSPQLASTPTRESSPSVPVVLPTATQPLQGMIAGTLMYPSEYIPPLRVVAFSVNDLSVYYSILTSENQSKFEIPVPPGT